MLRNDAISYTMSTLLTPTINHGVIYIILMASRLPMNVWTHIRKITMTLDPSVVNNFGVPNLSSLWAPQRSCPCRFGRH